MAQEVDERGESKSLRLVETRHLPRGNRKPVPAPTGCTLEISSESFTCVAIDPEET
jgi:hypothetical protein